MGKKGKAKKKQTGVMGPGLVNDVSEAVGSVEVKDSEDAGETGEEEERVEAPFEAGVVLGADEAELSSVPTLDEPAADSMPDSTFNAPPDDHPSEEQEPVDVEFAAGVVEGEAIEEAVEVLVESDAARGDWADLAELDVMDEDAQPTPSIGQEAATEIEPAAELEPVTEEEPVTEAAVTEAAVMEVADEEQAPPESADASGPLPFASESVFLAQMQAAVHAAEATASPFTIEDAAPAVEDEAAVEEAVSHAPESADLTLLRATESAYEIASEGSSIHPGVGVSEETDAVRTDAPAAQAATPVLGFSAQLTESELPIELPAYEDERAMYLPEKAAFVEEVVEVAAEAPPRASEVDAAPSGDSMHIDLSSVPGELADPIETAYSIGQREQMEASAAPEEVDYVEMFAPLVLPPSTPLLFPAHSASTQMSCVVTLAKMFFIVETAVASSKLDVMSCFTSWKLFSGLVAGVEVKKLEQRVQKLKGLLARTHQAKQRNQEDSAISQQKARELINSRAIDEKEKHLLLQAIKDQADETERQRAFHYDMEILIQRAASEMQSGPNTPQPKFNKSRYEGLEMEMDQLRAELRDRDQSEEYLLRQLDATALKVLEVTEQCSALERHKAESEEKLAALRRELREEANNRLDAEQELRILLSNQGELSSEIERKVREKYDLRKIEVSEEMEFARAQLEKALFELRTVEGRHSEMKREYDFATSRLKEADRLVAENEQLKSLLEEVKKTSFNQLVVAEQQMEKTVEMSTDFVQVGLGAAKTRVALEGQLSEVLIREKQMIKRSVIRMVETFTKLATRCIGPFLLSEAIGESFLRLTSFERELIDLLRMRLNSILEEKSETELKLQKEGSSGIPSTMQWSAKIHTILPGKEIRIPIPCLEDESTLEWIVSCSRDADYVELSIEPLKLGATITNAVATALTSSRIEENQKRNSNVHYTGEYTMVPSTGDKLLKIKNKAMLASITISYMVKLVLDKNKDYSAERRRAILQEYCDVKTSQVQYIDNAVAEAIGIRDKIASMKTRLIRAFPEETFDVSLDKLKNTNSKDDLHRLEKLAESIAKNNQRIKMPTTIMFNGQKFVVEDENKISYCAESLVLRASDDFRLYLQPPANVPYKLSWKFEVDTASAPKSDIGFSIVEQLPSGSLPQIVPYIRSRTSKEPSSIVLDRKENPDSTIIALFDNTYSWVAQKKISYTISIEPLSLFLATPAREVVEELQSKADSPFVAADLSSEFEVAAAEGSSVVVATDADAASLEPSALHDGAYELLNDAFSFHRNHAWLLESLLDKQTSSRRKDEEA